MNSIIPPIRERALDLNGYLSASWYRFLDLLSRAGARRPSGVAGHTVGYTGTVSFKAFTAVTGDRVDYLLIITPSAGGQTTGGGSVPLEFSPIVKTQAQIFDATTAIQIGTGAFLTTGTLTLATWAATSAPVTVTGSYFRQ